MPLHGYTRMFEKMLDHPNIKIMLDTDYRGHKGKVSTRDDLYRTVDEYFDYRYGKLPYRSLQFEHETHDRQRFQPAAVINYPERQLYTRVTEFKYLTGQDHPKTSIVYEYPQAEGDLLSGPRQRIRLCSSDTGAGRCTPGVHFVGRLATYKYYNMDQVVAQALAAFHGLPVCGDASVSPDETVQFRGNPASGVVIHRGSSTKVAPSVPHLAPRVQCGLPGESLSSFCWEFHHAIELHGHAVREVRSVAVNILLGVGARVHFWTDAVRQTSHVIEVWISRRGHRRG